MNKEQVPNISGIAVASLTALIFAACRSEPFVTLDPAPDPPRGLALIQEVAVGRAPHGIRFDEERGQVLVALSGDGQVAVLDDGSLEVIERIEVGGAPLDLVPAGGGWVVANFRGSQLSHHAVSTTLGPWEVGKGPSLFSPRVIEGRTVIPCEFADRLVVFDTGSDPGPVTSFPTGKRPYPADVTSDGVLAFVPNRDDGTVTVIDLLNQKVLATTAVGSEPEGGALTRDEADYIVACGGSNELVFVNTASFEVTARVTAGVGPQPFSVTTIPDGRHALVNNAGGNTLSVLDVTRRRVVDSIEVGQQPIVVRVHPDGERAFVSNEESGTLSVISLPSPPTASRNQPNEVIVLGMVHGGHTQSELYGLEKLEALVRAIDPHYVLVEIPPNRFEETVRGFERDGVVSEARSSRFPEYVEVIFPLTDEMDYEIIPTAAWNRHMNSYRSATLQRIEQDPQRAAEWQEYQRSKEARAEAMSGHEPDDPRWIHTDAYDDAVDLELGVYNRLFNDEIGPGGWDNINAGHYAGIERALEQHQGEGKRFLITYGAYHKGWFLRELRKRSDVVLLEVEPFLDAIE